MEIKECIILAGGLGTRLRSEVADLPKCMAPVAGKPFLHWVINYLLSQNVKSFVFSVGYMQEKIREYIERDHPNLDSQFAVEEEPLGTGGAIQLAMELCTEENILALNGDTLFDADLTRLADYHIQTNAACTLALKPVEDSDRYGAVDIDEQHNIISFSEKKYIPKGLINGGVYLLNRLAFQNADLPFKFSFEKDYLERSIGAQRMTGVPDDGYFIDIGIPEDFKKANLEIKEKYGAAS